MIIPFVCVLFWRENDWITFLNFTFNWCNILVNPLDGKMELTT